MMKPNLKIACAPLAIAAMAGLHSTPAAAQSQPQIVIDLPEEQPMAPQPATTAEPTIVLPDPEPVVSEPVIAPAEPAATATVEEPVESPVAAQPATTSRTDASAPVIAAATSPDDSVSNADMLPPVAAPVPRDAELAVARAEMAPAPPPIEDVSTSALILALLGVGGIGLLAFFLMRRRRRADVPVVEKLAVSQSAEPAPAPLLDREPAITSYDDAPVRTSATQAAPTFAATAPSSGATVELPRELPASFEERNSLLERMIAARPDRANPFRSPKARARRARLIMQSIGTCFRGRKPRIDLSQYPNIWPELRGWRSATT